MIRIRLALLGAVLLAGSLQARADEVPASFDNEQAPVDELNSVATGIHSHMPPPSAPAYYDGVPEGGPAMYGAVPAYGAPAMPGGGYVGSYGYWNAGAFPNCGCEGHCHHGKGGGCYPRWYVEAEAIFLWRDNQAIFQPVVVNSLSGATILDSTSADLDTGIGPRALVGVHLSDRSALEGQYFSALSFDGSATATGNADLATPGQLGLLGFDWSFADEMGIDYDSEIHSAELNYLHTWGRFSLITGFRFFRLTENYDLTATTDLITGPSTSFYDIDTKNDLYGAQLGGRYRRCHKRFFWEITGKAGIFGNDATQSQTLTDFDNSLVLRNATAEDSPVAFVGDVNLSIGWRLGRVWSVRGGYNAIWLDQVALGSDQLDFNLGPASGTSINTSGSVFMHGANIGLEGRW